jgi:magnesium transporter
MTNVSEQLLKYPLDIAERAHIDTDEDQLLITVDVAATELKDEKKVYTTVPLGMIILGDDLFFTVSQRKVDVLDYIINATKKNIINTEKKSRLIIQILYNIAQDYIRYMSYISKDIEMFEKHMEKSMKNKELMSLLEFEKCMIYFNASIKANQTVLQKINRGKVIKLYEEDEDILEDTLIENVQAMEMIQTYSEILNGIIDIFGTIVSNNLNIVMKFLTSITIIIAIPTMVASFIGMNVDFPFNTGYLAFYGVVILSVLLTVIVSIWLKRKDML